MLSEHAKNYLRHAGLNSTEVELLHQALAHAEHLSQPLDALRCTRSLQYAAQGGDGLALKLVTMPTHEETLYQAALAYGHLRPTL